MTKTKYTVKASPAEDPSHIVEEVLNTRDLRDRWADKLKQNGWKIISKNIKIVRG
jgi:hypothetical protein